MVIIRQLSSSESDDAVGRDENNEGKDDDDDQEVKKYCYCTFAITGCKPTFQAIFVCHGCCSSNTSHENQNQTSPFCICQSCAESCHSDHAEQVEYIGMGPSYCDCDQLGDCSILHQSNVEAERLGISKNNTKPASEIQPPPQVTSVVTVPQEQEEKPENKNDGTENKYVQDVYQIPVLLQPAEASRHTSDETMASSLTVTDMLIDQAHELIRHTKETLWVDHSMMVSMANDVDNVEYSPLEFLAYSIFQKHVQNYNLLLGNQNDNNNVEGGAEWWVQVKPITTTTTPLVHEEGGGNVQLGSTTSEARSENFDQNQPTKNEQAIDLHYDKDEALAESFSIGSFPVLSTVTYLTNSAPSANGSGESKDNSDTTNPTLVFPHMYHQGEDELMSNMLVSYPVPGKHLVFDGRLLHGAPSADELLRRNKPKKENPHRAEAASGPATECTPNHTKMISATADSPSNYSANAQAEVTAVSYRVTFLVNIWMDHKPANVQPLDPAIRQALLRRLKEQEENFSIRMDTSSWLLPAPTTSSDTVTSSSSDRIPNGSLAMIPLQIAEVTIANEEDLAPPFQSRIELPFVCKGITWDDEDYFNDDDDNTNGIDNSGLVVVTFPPPLTSSDTLLVKFGPGMQAYMEYIEEKEGYVEFNRRRHQAPTDPAGEGGGGEVSPQLVEEDYV